MWVTKLLISSVKKGFFAQKRPNLARNWLFLSGAGSFGALLVGWLVAVARAVSCKTPIYFIIFYFHTNKKDTAWQSGRVTAVEAQIYPSFLFPLRDLLEKATVIQCGKKLQSVICECY